MLKGRTDHKIILNVANILSLIPLFLCILISQQKSLEIKVIGSLIGIGFLAIALSFWGWDRLNRRKRFGKNINLISTSKKIHTHTKHLIYRYIPLFCIATGETIKLSFLVYLREVKGNVDVLLAVWMILAILFPTIIGFISDKYCRKTTLSLTLACALFSVIFLAYGNYWLAVIVNGSLVAITSVGRAAYCDVHDLRDKVKVLSETIIAQSIPWIILGINPWVFKNCLIWIALGAIFLSFWGVVLCFEDRRDKEAKQIGVHEIRSAFKKYLNRYSLRLLCTFFIFDLAFQLANYFAETYESSEQLRVVLLMVEGVGIFTGTLIVRIFDIRASWKTLLCSSLFLFLIFFFTWLTSAVTGELIFGIFNLLMFSFGGGIVLPLIFGHFASKVEPHETGMLYGILEGIETLAEAFMPIFLYVDKTFIPHRGHHLTTLPFLVLIGIGIFFILKKEKNVNKSEKKQF